MKEIKKAIQFDEYEYEDMERARSLIASEIDVAEMHKTTLWTESVWNDLT